MMMGKDGNSVGHDILASIGQFNLIFIGSLLIGAVSALLISFMLKRQSSHKETSQREAVEEELVENREEREEQIAAKKRMDENREAQAMNAEVAMMLVCPWVAYLISEGLGLSGIVAILTNGVVLQIYANPNLSKGAKNVLKLGYETFAYAFETLVFLFLGIGLTAFNHPYK
jgi:NhaP-type Na+/H+ or K+/H+ antiporter